MQIQGNSSATFIQRMLTNTNDDLNTRMARLSAALRITSAADDAAGLAISEGMRAQIGGITQAERNTQDGISVLQTAEGGMEEIQGMTQRLRDLSVQAANDTLTDEDRALIQREATQLTQEINRSAQTVQYNGKPLLDGTYAPGGQALTLQVGANQGQTVEVNLAEMSATALGINTVDITTRAGAEQAIGTLDTALGRIAEQRTGVGATENRLAKTFDFLGIQNEATTASESRIRDADMATELIGLVRAQVQQQAGLGMLAQANLSARSVTALLG